MDTNAPLLYFSQLLHSEVQLGRHDGVEHTAVLDELAP